MIKKIMLILFISGALFLSTPNNSTAAPNKAASYVGAAKCRECHGDIYEGWKSTLHPYKFQKASPDNIVGDFNKNNSLEIGGRHTTMRQKGEDFFISTAGSDKKIQTYKVNYVIGEFWKQLYVTEFPNGELHILPVMWIVKTQQWKETKAWSKNIIYQNA